MRAFTVHRFSRLYPLHLLTLLVVAALQLLSLASRGQTQIYGNFDLYHFGLNLLFASHWGLERGYSFNGPVWSVSVEILVYALFFVLLPYLFRLGPWLPLALAAAGMALADGPGTALAGCIGYFFLGVACQRVLVLWRPPVVMGLVLAGAACLPLLYGSPGSWTLAVGFAVVLLLAGLVDLQDRAGWPARLRWLGDSTYGLYLWHVPVQIAINTALDATGTERSIADAPWFLLAFLATVFGIARLSFVAFERPAQDFLRQRLR